MLSTLHVRATLQQTLQQLLSHFVRCCGLGGSSPSFSISKRASLLMTGLQRLHTLHEKPGPSAAKVDTVIKNVHVTEPSRSLQVCGMSVQGKATALDWMIG